MIASFSTLLPPGLLLIAGAILLPLVPARLSGAYMLMLPVLGFLQLLALPAEASVTIELFGLTLELLRVDRLSLLFGYIFHIAAFLSIIYALGIRDTMQRVAALIYAGAAIAALFAGDLVTLFVYWELTAISSVFLIWASRNERAYRAGMRYLVIQVGSGVILFVGLLLHYNETGSIEFDHLGLSSMGTALIFAAFGIKCAFPLMHNWLQDAYPEATVTGTVFLSAFTTKLAVYTLARGFAGTEMLIWIGALMAAFPIFYAVIENDLRRVLAYSLNNQLGFMVVGIGVGTELALNGTAAHAFAHILYKALLFMSVGAVLLRTGTAKGSELGGLYKSMPLTAAFCIVGAASISAFPLFSGFVSKSLIMSATVDNGYLWVWLVLLFASAGVVEHAGIKVPYFAFFGPDNGTRVAEAPRSMLIAMGLTAFLCIAIGVYPAPLYLILPYATDYDPYTVTHVVTQLQLLLLAILGVAVLMRTGLYPHEQRAINLDFDWIYRKAAPIAISTMVAVAAPVDAGFRRGVISRFNRLVDGLFRHHGPRGILARTWPTGSMVLWVAILLASYLIIYYL
ncbi:MAG: Na(+)/H(+) antiporter subunit D [Proteobacteria bacterium]|nr:MAG: Na(+)/H(+) antiporter subunit D [Pseudomonadota bacterium]